MAQALAAVAAAQRGGVLLLGAGIGPSFAVALALGRSNDPAGDGGIAEAVSGGNGTTSGFVHVGVLDGHRQRSADHIIVNITGTRTGRTTARSRLGEIGTIGSVLDGSAADLAGHVGVDVLNGTGLAPALGMGQISGLNGGHQTKGQSGDNKGFLKHVTSLTKCLKDR